MHLIIWLISLFISASVQEQWKQVAPGLEHRVLSVKLEEYSYRIEINAIRIDPDKWDFVFRGISQEIEAESKTPKEWCEKYNLTAAINAGMYNGDYRTHTGYLRDGAHVNSRGRNSYKSLLAFNPKPNNSVPPVKIFDIDQPGVTIDSVLKDYGTVIQNLRLIRRPGINVWGQQQNIWTEAALAEDRQGRIIFLYSSTPVSMHDFSKILLSSDLAVVAAQHLDGNAPAQLYLKTGKTELILSEEPGLELPLPNIIGIRLRQARSN